MLRVTNVYRQYSTVTIRHYSLKLLSCAEVLSLDSLKCTLTQRPLLNKWSVTSRESRAYCKLISETLLKPP